MAVGCMEREREDELQKGPETTFRVMEMFIILIGAWF